LQRLLTSSQREGHEGREEHEGVRLEDLDGSVKGSDERQPRGARLIDKQESANQNAAEFVGALIRTLLLVYPRLRRGRSLHMLINGPFAIFASFVLFVRHRSSCQPIVLIVAFVLIMLEVHARAVDLETVRLKPDTTDTPS
jgi:hypothetical protein